MRIQLKSSGFEMEKACEILKDQSLVGSWDRDGEKKNHIQGGGGLFIFKNPKFFFLWFLYL